MRKFRLTSLAVALLVLSVAAGPARAAEPAAPQAQAPLSGTITWCGAQVSAPTNLPPAGSGPVLYLLGVCFPEQGGVSVIEPETYRYYIQTKRSLPSQNAWVPWDQSLEDGLRADFKRLWGTNFLDNLSVEVTDYQFPNGVIGKLVAYNMEERQRVKIVDYVGSKKIEQTKIDEKLKENNSIIRLDSFLDPGVIKRVTTTIREMLAEKGYQFAVVTPEIKPIGGGPKLVNLSFHIDEGPQVRIRDIEFVGNGAIPDWRLAREMKSNKPEWFLSFVTGRGTYQEGKYEEDAEKVVGFYRDRGYITVRVGEPELRVLEDSTDRRTRYVSLRIPVNEGERYKVGEVTFDGNTVVKPEPLRLLFKLHPNDWYSDKAIRKGLEKAREVYGSVGYFEFTGYPDLQPRDEVARAQAERAQQDGAARPADGEAAAGEPKPAGGEKPAEGEKPAGGEKPAEGEKPAAGAAAAAAKPLRAPSGEPLVDVTMRLQEGKQYFINRITFVGNTTTRDNVVRRELRLFENGVFNTEALKYAIKRINQLGYFKALEGGGRRQRREDHGGGQPGRRDAEVRGAEPEPDYLRRRRVAVGGLLRPARVPDRELHGPRRDPDALAAGRLAGAELPDSLHRAVPVRPRHHGRHRHLQAGVPLHLAVHAVLVRRQRGLRVPAARLHPDVLQLQLRDRPCEGHQPDLHDPRVHRRQPVPRRLPAAGRGQQLPDGQQGRAEHRPQHGGQSDFPQRAGHAILSRSTWPAWAATPTSTSRASRRCGSSRTRGGRRLACAPRPSTSTSSGGTRRCRCSSGCSSAASTASEASTSGRSARSCRTGW